MRWLFIAGIVITPILMEAPIRGVLSSPWAPWWLSSSALTGGQINASSGMPVVALGPEATDIDFPIDPANLALGHGHVSDMQRYVLAVAAGWSREEAIIATAISIAEDGSGDPAALSPPNWNKTRDLGLWQINSIHWPGCGGPTALTDPLTNARCGHSIFGSGNWCAWSTYTPCSPHPCGPPCYLDFMARARAAAVTPPPAGQV